MSLRLFQHWTTRVAEFTQGRKPQSDDAFIAECGLPDDPEARRVAVGVRQVFGEEGSVDPQLIFATDRYPEDLEILPSWDSLDTVDLLMRIEEKLNIRIPDRDAERLFQRRFTVREFVAGMVAYCGRRRAAT
jgi:acyl carrier protein